MSDGPVQVFSPQAVRTHRERAARADRDAEFLFEAVAENLADRFEDIDRSFPLALELGSRGGALCAALGGRRIERLIATDPVAAFRPEIVADPEFLPFAEARFDAVLSVLSLHWVNDLPGALVQLRRALKPDGLLLAALLGGDTLTELRQVLLEAEIEEEGGAGPRVSPFADIRDVGALLQRAGFALPVVDTERLTATYPDALALMRDLRAMGETSAIAERRRGFTRRATLARAAALYAERFARPDGTIPATFQVITMTAWAPHESQQRPLRPGSAEARLADALGTREERSGKR